MNYADAKRLIYIPAYKYVLDNVPEVQNIIQRIKKQSEISDIVLLDYNLNPDNRDASKPLSHAELVKMYIEDRYPEKEEDFRPWTEEELAQLKKAKLKTKSPEAREISASELKDFTDEIVAILNEEEITTARLTKKLGIKVDSTALTKFLKTIKSIRIIKAKRTLYYTLKPEDVGLF